eukprot:CAMPEP_0175255268 /NCGR_PEP_ID=MMETSP0093-20121207/37612_1 /TAXON_ID=311494 /ORGANISM="Alexandrium monilatum, Strain CCMP3105" /LENGTH=36 /DNA_ID= /DNA_START= /DNA_END= /DNA_ORIENTATION=
MSSCRAESFVLLGSVIRALPKTSEERSWRFISVASM